MFKNVLIYIAVVLISAGLSACGNKGGLYIPVSDCDTGDGQLCEQQEK